MYLVSFENVFNVGEKERVPLGHEVETYSSVKGLQLENTCLLSVIVLCKYDHSVDCNMNLYRFVCCISPLFLWWQYCFFMCKILCFLHKNERFLLSEMLCSWYILYIWFLINLYIHFYYQMYTVYMRFLRCLLILIMQEPSWLQNFRSTDLCQCC